MRLFECLLTGLLLFFCSYLRAQKRSGHLQGHIFLDDHTGIDAAAVMLMNARDSSLAYTVWSDKSGRFTFDRIKSGDYYVLVRKFAFQQYQTGTIHITAEKLMILPDIFLKPSVTRLKEIVVVNKKLFIENHPDKTVLNVSKGILTTGTSVLDVLAAAPGVRISNNDALSFRGGQPPLIMINGTVTHLSAQDVQTMLRDMPSDNVESIELISIPTSRYDASGSGGVINISMKT